MRHCDKWATITLGSMEGELGSVDDTPAGQAQGPHIKGFRVLMQSHF